MYSPYDYTSCGDAIHLIAPAPFARAIAAWRPDIRATSLKNAPERGALNFAAESGNRFEPAGPAAALRYRLNGASVSLKLRRLVFSVAFCRREPALPVKDREIRRRARRLVTVVVRLRSLHRWGGSTVPAGRSIGLGAVWDEAGGFTGGTGLTMSGG